MVLAMIADESVTLAKLAHAAANTVLVRDANSLVTHLLRQ